MLGSHIRQWHERLTPDWWETVLESFPHLRGPLGVS